MTEQIALCIPVEVSLSDNERVRFSELKQVVRNGIKTFVDVGTALLEIRDKRYYREDFKTFEDYCQSEHGIARRTAYRFMDAAEIVENVSNWTQILPANESQVRPLVSLPADLQPVAWQQAIDTAPNGKITAAHVQSVVDSIIPEKRPVSYHVSDDSYDWFTPSEYIEAARLVMGSIDLDPASSKEAQEVVNAGVYYTKETDGLSQPWFGNVWLNPPYNMPLIEQFIDMTINGYLSGEINSAIVLTNNSTDTGWFHKLISYPVCFTKGRIQFWNGNERLATRQGQAIFYLGNNPDLFASVFSAFGVVLKRYDNR